MRSPLRIVDANANRAREALRLLEDQARFMLDDSALSARTKAVRHTLTQIISEQFGGKHRVLADRDTPGDVGTSVSVDTEAIRSSTLQLAEAAGSRLTEALRTIEECLKLSSPDAAAQIEKLRYEAYEIECQLLPKLARPNPFMRVCLLLTESLCEHHSWKDVANDAIRGGVNGIQLREKSLSDRELLTRARWLVEATRGSGVRVIINDRPDIAALAGADGVHLGQDDLSIADARAIVGYHTLIGVTTSLIKQAKQAFDDGADMIGFGPVFASGTKPKPNLIGLETINALIGDDELNTKPYLAISGIDLKNAARLAEIGCAGIAVSSAICGSEDPEGITKTLMETMSPRAASVQPE